MEILFGILGMIVFAIVMFAPKEQNSRSLSEDEETLAALIFWGEAMDELDRRH